MNTAVVSAAMIYINSTGIKEAFQRNWLSPFASPDSSPFRVLVTSVIAIATDNHIMHHLFYCENSYLL